MTLSRRGFLGHLAAGTAALGVPAHSRWRSLGANGDLRVAVVGLRGRGGDHIDGFRKLDGVRVVALCDADRAILEREAAKFEARQEKVARFVDIRKLLDDADVDAISVATPNHWHSLMAIWACQAGKDVYLEKPISHNVLEGRRVVEAARKYQRIVACGTQARSNPGMREMIEFVHKGELGKLLLARGLCYKPRPSIGKVDGEQKPPASVDYDLWTGPAPLEPLRRKNLHYDWHWLWATGNGDLGNQGIHQMDMCRWALGVDHLAPRVFSVGGRVGYDDDGETYNTQLLVHQYDTAPLVFEVRGLPAERDGKQMDRYRGAAVGAVFHCEGGYVATDHYEGGKAYDKDGKELRTFSGSGDHYANFVKAVRSRKHEDLNADILEGHLSSALCHTGNISCQVGAARTPEAIAERIAGNEAAAETWARMREHLERNGVDCRKEQLRLGEWLEMDPETERFIDNETANALLTRAYRAPYVVPDEV